MEPTLRDRYSAARQAPVTEWEDEGPVGDNAIDEAASGAVAAAAQPRTPPERLLWNGAWLVVCVLSAAALAFTFPQAIWPVVPAMLAGAAPAAVALLPRAGVGARGQALLLALWAAAGGVACTLAGGVAGPLAVWCLAPVAAASAMGGGRRLAEGAALAFMAAAVSALAGLSGLTPPPPQGGPAFWLGLVALATTGLGLGAGLIMAERRVVRREIRRDDEVERLRAVLDEQPWLILTLYPHGQVRTAYGAAPEGVSRDALLRHGLTAAAPNGPDRVALGEALRKAMADGQAEVGFTPLTAMDRWASVRIRRIEENLLIAVVRDATGERARETALDQARQDAEALAAGKSRFLANMSHELRTPLNAIMGFSDIMRVKMFGPLPDKYAEYSEMIHESGQHLLDLINDVLDMSKIEAERFELSREDFDAREAVSASLRLLRLQADGAGVQLRGVLPAEPLEVEADRRAIKQIVLNLVSNALKFTPKGGAVTVTAHGYHDVFELIVADTGVGISPEDLERLGRPYEQAGDSMRRQMGTGLGLSLVRSFSELHGGEMLIESALGEGTTVTVRLPVLAQGVQDTPPPAGGNVVAFNPQR
jgi:cell cycle sensor histidine kinase DivJ